MSRITLSLNDGEHRQFKSVADDMGLDIRSMLRELVHAKRVAQIEQMLTRGQKKSGRNANNSK